MDKIWPSHWIKGTLDHVVSRITNGTSANQLDIPVDGSYPITRIETIAQEKVNLNRVKYVIVDDIQVEKFKLAKGDILFSHINSDKHLGKTALFTLDETVIHGINLLLIRTKENYDGAFLNYLFRLYRYQGKFSAVAQRAVNQSSINQKKLLAFPVPIPPLAEQKRIVAKLDEAFKHLEILKAKLERIPKLLKKFRHTVLTHAVTGKLTEEWRKGKELGEWKEVKLGDIISFGPQNGLYMPQKAYGRGVPIVRIDNFYDGVIDSWSSLRRLTIDDSVKNTYALENNDILINRVNSMSHLGKSGLVTGLDEGCVFESNIMRLKLDNTLALSTYIIQFLCSPNGYAELRKNAKQAVNQASINQTDVREVALQLPPLPEQKVITEKVEALFLMAEHVESTYMSLLKKIDKLPQLLLTKAFKGELISLQSGSDKSSKETAGNIEAGATSKLFEIEIN